MGIDCTVALRAVMCISAYPFGDKTFDDTFASYIMWDTKYGPCMYQSINRMIYLQKDAAICVTILHYPHILPYHGRYLIYYCVMMLFCSLFAMNN